MQKKLIALAIAGLVSAPAFAQSNVTIYGRVDLSIVTQQKDAVGGVGLSEVEGSSSRWGLRGTEDLGSGWSVFFELENRFYADSGDINNAAAGRTSMFKDKSWLGLENKALGSVAFGRIATAFDTSHGGGNSEIWDGDTLAANPSRRARAQTRFDNGVRYTSPVLGPFRGYTAARFESGTTSTIENRQAYDVGGELTFGFVKVAGTFQKDHTTAYETWGVASRIQPIQPLQIKLSYATSEGFADNGVAAPLNDRTAAGIGASWDIGAASIRANYGRVWTTASSATSTNGADETKIGAGVWYSLSKRTSTWAQLVRGTVYNSGSQSNIKTSSNGAQIGLRHNF